MSAQKPASADPRRALPKAATGISGLDAILEGGLPRGRNTLVYGNAGSGKTLLATEFLVRGARDHDEPGVLLSFDESPEKLARDTDSLGWDIDGLAGAGRLYLLDGRLGPESISEVGAYDLSGVFAQLGHAVARVGARRVLLDAVDNLLVRFGDARTVRDEFRRLLMWLEEQGLTAVITAEGSLEGTTREGVAEYLTDCVIRMDHRLQEQVATRRIRVTKYRGSPHQNDEYPFLITTSGLSIIPISGAGLDYDASTERVSSGIPDLDTMLEGQGFFRGTTVLVSGSAGTGKTTLAGHFLAAGCARGERAAYLAFEEAPRQIVRNLASVGLDLAAYEASGQLRFHSVRPASAGLESHLSRLQSVVDGLDAQVVALDPISSFSPIGDTQQIKAMLVRLIHHLRSRGITALLTHLVHDSVAPDDWGSISSLADTWVVLRERERDRRRHKTLYIRKSRGMSHSDRVHLLEMSPSGIRLRDLPE